MLSRGTMHDMSSRASRCGRRRNRLRDGLLETAETLGVRALRYAMQPVRENAHIASNRLMPLRARLLGQGWVMPDEKNPLSGGCFAIRRYLVSER